MWGFGTDESGRILLDLLREVAQVRKDGIQLVENFGKAPLVVVQGKIGALGKMVDGFERGNQIVVQRTRVDALDFFLSSATLTLATTVRTGISKWMRMTSPFWMFLTGR